MSETQSCLNCGWFGEHEHGPQYGECRAPIPACVLDCIDVETARTVPRRAPHGYCRTWKPKEDPT